MHEKRFRVVVPANCLRRGACQATVVEDGVRNFRDIDLIRRQFVSGPTGCRVCESNVVVEEVTEVTGRGGIGIRE